MGAQSEARDGQGDRFSGSPCAHGDRESDWGYRRIQGALSHLGHLVARGTVANILKKRGIDPSPATEPSDQLEGVLEPPLGTAGRGGLLHRGSMDASRTAAAAWCCCSSTCPADMCRSLGLELKPTDCR